MRKMHARLVPTASRPSCQSKHLTQCPSSATWPPPLPLPLLLLLLLLLPPLLLLLPACRLLALLFAAAHATLGLEGAPPLPLRCGGDDTGPGGGGPPKPSSPLPPLKSSPECCCTSNSTSCCSGGLPKRRMPLPLLLPGPSRSRQPRLPPPPRLPLLWCLSFARVTLYVPVSSPSSPPSPSPCSACLMSTSRRHFADRPVRSRPTSPSSASSHHRTTPSAPPVTSAPGDKVSACAGPPWCAANAKMLWESRLFFKSKVHHTFVQTC